MAYKDVPNNFNPSVIVLAAAAGIFGYWLYRKDVPNPVTSDFDSEDYMVDNPEYPEIYHSTDDEGGTLFYELKTGGPLSRGGPLRPVGQTRRQDEGISAPNRKIEADQGYYNYPRPTGGTFVNPGVLPPVRTATIQAGRFIHPEILPEMVHYELQ